MNHKDDITPEQKLLNLIRGSSKKPPKEKHVPQASQQQEGGLPKPIKTSADTKANYVNKEKISILRSISSHNLILINRLILLGVFLGLLFLLLDLYLTPADISRVTPSSLVTTKKMPLMAKEDKPYSYYQQEILKRNLFKSDAVESRVNKVVPTGQTFKELVKDLQLLGIMSGDKPQAIIEDKKLNKTYFLNIGDYLGEIRLDAISSDNVTLEFNGEKITLFL